MPRSPPLPVLATFVVSTLSLTVIFDRLLTPGPLDPLNWVLLAGITVYTGVPPAVAVGNEIRSQMVAGIPSPGPEVVAYLPPPFDVLSSFGIPAAGFIDFPLTVLP